MCVCVFNEERKRRGREKKNCLHIARISIIILFIALSHAVVCVSIYTYIHICVCVYVKETTTKEAQQCLKGRARLNDKYILSFSLKNNNNNMDTVRTSN
jgi:hypothetical protein